MPGLLSGLAQGGQQKSNQNHGGDQENILSENQQTYHSGTYANDGRNVIFRAEPLFYENRNEKGSQSKVHTLIIDRKQRAGQRAQNGTADPIQMIE